MSKKTSRPENSELREEYDFSEGERGKYARAFREGSNVVVVDPDLAEEFPNAKAVNAALRAYLANKKGAA